MANDCKKIPGALFEIFTFFTFMRYRSLNFPIFWTSNLVLLVTSKRIKLEMPDWSHFKEFLKLFQTGTIFLWIRQKVTELWLVKHEQFLGDLERFSHHLFCSLILNLDASLAPHICMGAVMCMSVHLLVCQSVCWPFNLWPLSCLKTEGLDYGLTALTVRIWA